MIMKSRLRWVGHVVRLDEERLPKRVFYGELFGKRPPCKPRKRYKDCLKESLKKSEIALETWEQDAKDRVMWRELVNTSVINFERRRLKHAAAKRALRKGLHGDVRELHACNMCNRVCASKAGLVSHLRSHSHHGQTYTYQIKNPFSCISCNRTCKSASGLARHAKVCNPTVKQSNNQLSCVVCGLLCRSLAGLKSHLRKHQRQSSLQDS